MAHQDIETAATRLSTTAWIMIFTPFALMFFLAVGKVWWEYMVSPPPTPKELCREDARRRLERCSRELFTRQSRCDKTFDAETKACDGL